MSRSGVRIAIFTVVVSTFALTAGQPAQAFRPSHDLPVLQVPGSRNFEVVQQHASGPREVWCAAAEHARDVLRLPTATRLYIAKGRGPSALAGGRTAIRFSPEPVAPTGPQQDSKYSVSLNYVGFSLSIGHASSFCRDRVEDFFKHF